MGGAATLRWPPFHQKTQQPTEDRLLWGGGVADESDRGGTPGVDYFLPFWGGEWGDQRERERDRASALAATPSRTDATTNQKQYQRWGGYLGRDSAAAEHWGGDDYPSISTAIRETKN